MAAMDQLSGIIGLIDSVQGKKTSGTTKSSGTQTTQTNVSDAGINQIIQNILSGQGGVQSIGGAARRSGLYNSSTEDMLLGDLYARAANQAELARSPTTTTTSGVQSTQQQVGGVGLGGLGTVIGGGMALNQLFQAGKGLFGDGALGAGAVSNGGGILGGLGSLFGGSSGGLTAGSGGIGGLATSIGPESLRMLSGAGSAGTAGAAAGGLSGLGSFASLAPYGGGFLGGLLGGMGEGSAKTEDYLGGAASGAMAGAAGGPVGMAIGAALGALGTGASDMSVICTALHGKGLVSTELFKAGHAHLDKVDREVIQGYYIWATPIAKKIEAGNKFWKWAMFLPCQAYLRFEASDKGVLDCIENLPGFLFHTVGHVACKLLFRASLYLKMKSLEV